MKKQRQTKTTIDGHYKCYVTWTNTNGAMDLTKEGGQWEIIYL